MTAGEDLAARLALMVVTHARPACGRNLIDVVGECLEAGATAIQLRDKQASAAELLAIAAQLRDLSVQYDALLVVNDRFDLALAAGADGVHLGPEDLPVDAVRSVVPADFIIGFSTETADGAQAAEEEGASYLGVGAIYGTSSKPGLKDERIGVGRLRDVTQAVSIPIVGIGGITPGNAADVYAAGAGVAVLAAVMGDPEPGEAVRAILNTRNTRLENPGAGAKPQRQ